ncbi:MAG: hypothetical protein K8S98_06230 [Planctomycetes bacterium]|nr:hypothetical protein [Planctomycetota bacterium]
MLALLSVQDPTESALAWMHTHAAADAALVAGRLDEARAGFEHCRELEPQNATIAYALACVAARSGDLDRAFAALDDARNLGFRDAALAEWDADLESLKHDSRWPLFTSARDTTNELTQLPVFPWITTSATKDWDFTAFAEVSVPGECVIVGDSLGRVRRLNLRTGEWVCDYEPVNGPVWRIATHPGAAEFAVLTTRAQLSFFRCDESAPFARGLAFPEVYSGPWIYPFWSYLEYSPDGIRVATRSTKRGAGVWSSRGEKLYDLEPTGMEPSCVDLAWSADGTSIALRKGRELTLYDSTSGEILDRLMTPSDILCARFDPTGARLATGHADSTVRLWDACTFAPIGSFKVPDDPVFREVRTVNSLAFTLDGARLAYAACEAVYLGVLDARTGARVFECDGFDGHWCEPVGLLVDHDASSILYSPGCGGWIQGTRVGKFERFPSMQGNTPRVNRSGLVAFSSGDGVVCFDVERRVIRWTRSLPNSVAVPQAGSGHFGVVPRTISTLWVVRGYSGDEREPLVTHATSLFDPKRVRASLDGVELELWR